MKSPFQEVPSGVLGTMPSRPTSYTSFYMPSIYMTSWWTSVPGQIWVTSRISTYIIIIIKNQMYNKKCPMQAYRSSNYFSFFNKFMNLYCNLFPHFLSYSHLISWYFMPLLIVLYLFPNVYSIMKCIFYHQGFGEFNDISKD